MEKDAGLDFHATITVEEARKKLHTNFLTKETKQIVKPIGFFSRLKKKVFKKYE